MNYNIPHYRVMVESQLPPTAVNLSIEDCIHDIDDYIKSLNHADFKIHVNALKAAKVRRRSYFIFEYRAF